MQPNPNELPPEDESSEPVEQKKPFSIRLFERSGGAAQRPDKERKKLMKRFRKAKKIPSETEVERFRPDLDKGLTERQVGIRNSQFLFNDVNKRYSKSYASIFAGNICTFFNLLCLIVAVAPPTFSTRTRQDPLEMYEPA